MDIVSAAATRTHDDARRIAGVENLKQVGVVNPSTDDRRGRRCGCDEARVGMEWMTKRSRALRRMLGPCGRE